MRKLIGYSIALILTIAFYLALVIALDVAWWIPLVIIGGSAAVAFLIYLAVDLIMD